MEKPYKDVREVTYEMITTHPYFRCLNHDELEDVIGNMDFDGYAKLPGHLSHAKAITLMEEFRKSVDIHPGVFIRCNSKEEFEQVLTICQKEGIRWMSGDLPLHLLSYWHEGMSVIFVKYGEYIAYSSIESSIKDSIISASEFITIKSQTNNFKTKTMEKSFTISGSLALQIAFLKETESSYYEGVSTLEKDYKDFPYMYYSGNEDDYDFASSSAPYPVNFSLPEQWEEAKEYLNKIKEESKEIEMDGYKATYSKGQVTFGCNVLTKENLQTMKDIIALCKNLDYSSLTVTPDDICVTDNDDRRFTPALIDKLLSHI